MCARGIIPMCLLQHWIIMPVAGMGGGWGLSVKPITCHKHGRGCMVVPCMQLHHTIFRASMPYTCRKHERHVCRMTMPVALPEVRTHALNSTVTYWSCIGSVLESICKSPQLIALRVNMCSSSVSTDAEACNILSSIYQVLQIFDIYTRHFR
jgi:hypothetical protein